VEAGLDIQGVREETDDLCFPECRDGDCRIQAFLDPVRSSPNPRALGELPGHDIAEMGELHRSR
jgi:hypothetical protein